MTGHQIKNALIIGALIIVVPIILLVLFRKNIFTAVLKGEQKSFISKLHAKVQDKFKQFIEAVQKETDYNVIVTSSYITWAEQQKLHEADQQKPKAGDSLSNYGLAITMNAVSGTRLLRKSSSKEAWIKSGIPDIAKKMGIKWGGHDTNNYSPVRFDLSGSYNVSTLRDIALKQFKTTPQDIKGNEIKLPFPMRRIKGD